MNARSLICAGALFALPLTFGCSDDGSSQPDAGEDPTTDGMQGGDVDGNNNGTDASPGETFTLTWEGVTVPPGEEDTRCVIKRLGNTERIYVNRVHNLLGETSHHMIVYKANATEEQLDPQPCTGFSGALAGDAPLVISQKKDDLLTLPENVAFSIAPNELVRLELHYLNASDEPVEVVATSTFYTTPKTDELQEANFVFMGTSDISLPPRQETSVGPVYFPIDESYGLSGANFFAITGHTHKLGTNVYVATAESEGGADTPVYDLNDFYWAEPETVYYKETPFQLPEGGGFRFQCDYNNETDQTVGFGESTEDEMCFFWAYYYPSTGSKLCSDIFGGSLQCVSL